MLHTCSKKKIEKFTFVAPACDCQWPLFVQFNFSPQIAINIAAQVNRKKTMNSAIIAEHFNLSRGEFNLKSTGSSKINIYASFKVYN